MNRVSQQSTLVVRRLPGPAVIAVTGEVDADNCGELAAGLAELLSRESAGDVALDLGELTHLSSAGIRALLDCRELAERRGGRLTIRRAHEHVRQVLAICDLTDLFEPPPA